MYNKTNYYEEILNNITIQPNGCWHWTGRIDNRGYGRFFGQLVHRLVIEHFHGEIKKGMCVDHICHNEDVACNEGTSCKHRRCCNPDHLRVVTNRENILATSHSLPAINAAKTSCKNGHPLAGDNLYLYQGKHGQERGCRTCRAAAVDRFRARQAQKVAA